MRGGKRAGRVLGAAAAGLAGAAVAKELRTPRSRRRWHGRVLGVPYDFRVPRLSRIRRTWWNPAGDRVLVPRAFGLGWGVNLARVARLAGLRRSRS